MQEFGGEQPVVRWTSRLFGHGYKNFPKIWDLHIFFLRRRGDLKQALNWGPTRFWAPLPPWHNSPYWARASSKSRLHSDTETHHRDLYLTTHNTHKRQASMPVAGFEPAGPARERPRTHALDRAATAGIGRYLGPRQEIKTSGVARYSCTAALRYCRSQHYR